jgi:SAM-dependent methyltransferase
MRLDSSTGTGHYARKQLLSASRLIAWTHRRRFETAVRLAREVGGTRVLDYGCGDGTFVALLMQDSNPPASAVGAEIAHDLIADCRSRLGHKSGLSFVSCDELDGGEHRGTYEAVFCMEVLEHVVDRGPVLDRLASLLARDGRLLVSVPVEIGPVLPVKQLARRVAGWRGIGDYPGTTAYTPGELLAGLFAGSRQRVERPIHVGADGARFHDHKGFNWRVLREELRLRLEIVRIVTSPVAWLPPLLASQVWLVTRPRRSPTIP